MALDRQLLQEAKKRFGEEFLPQIATLGYNLAYGIIKVNNSFGIAARVQSENPIPEIVRQQIEGILPKQYHYKGYEIPVELIYMDIPHAR